MLTQACPCRPGQESQREAPFSCPATPSAPSGAAGTFFLPVSKQSCWEETASPSPPKGRASGPGRAGEEASTQPRTALSHGRAHRPLCQTHGPRRADKGCPTAPKTTRPPAALPTPKDTKRASAALATPGSPAAHRPPAAAQSRQGLSAGCPRTEQARDRGPAGQDSPEVLPPAPLPALAPPPDPGQGLPHTPSQVTTSGTLSPRHLEIQARKGAGPNSGGPSGSPRRLVWEAGRAPRSPRLGREANQGLRRQPGDQSRPSETQAGPRAARGSWDLLEGAP